MGRAYEPGSGNGAGKAVERAAWAYLFAVYTVARTITGGR